MSTLPLTERRWCPLFTLVCRMYVGVSSVTALIWFCVLPGSWGGKGGLEWEPDLRARVLFFVGSWLFLLAISFVMAVVRVCLHQRKEAVWDVVFASLCVLSLFWMAPLLQHTK